MLSRFNLARGGNDFGDQWVMKQGFTLVWLGWEWDIPASNTSALHFTGAALSRGRRRGRAGALGVHAGEGGDDDAAGRSDAGCDPGWQGDRDVYAQRSGRYAATDRGGELFALGERSGIEMPGGFEAGMLYEFVYQGKDPVVAGAGLAAVRDFISCLKYGGELQGWTGARPNVKLAIGFGISQSGRWLREFVYDGFNADENGRKVFDGIWADVAGAGRGSFNFRYAQPSRDGWPYLNVFYPTDLFPFTDTAETDPLTGKTAGLLDRARSAGVQPKLFLTNDSSEYWGRAASLVHVTADGKHDAPVSPETRIYFTAGAQHSPGALPIARRGTVNNVDVVDHRPVQRALLADLAAWVQDGTPPPPSVYPRLADGQLTDLAGLKFPKLEGVQTPPHPRVARRLDFGPEFESRGVITVEPPKVTGTFPLLLPQVDGDGIDLGGVRLPEVAVPLATLTGWNLRAPERGAPAELAEFYGSIFPLAASKDARVKTHDPRLSIAERYAGREDYLKRVTAAADDLVRRRFVLPQDRGLVVDRAMKLWDAVVR